MSSATPTRRCSYCRRGRPAWWLVGGWIRTLPNGLRRCLRCAARGQLERVGYSRWNRRAR